MEEISCRALLFFFFKSSLSFFGGGAFPEGTSLALNLDILSLYM